MGLDDEDFNLRRLERYLALAHASSIAPVVVLTKDDVARAEPGTRAARLDELEARLPAGLEVIAVDATDPASAGPASRISRPSAAPSCCSARRVPASRRSRTRCSAAPCRTPARCASTTAAACTSTTARSLHLLPGGACVIDTPGLRTLRPDVDDAATLAASFEDVATLSAACRFRDCTHAGEPGCAVRDGVDPDRLRNFQKLLRETRRDTLSYVERRQQLAAWKSRGKATRERMRMKRGE